MPRTNPLILILLFCYIITPSLAQSCTEYLKSLKSLMLSDRQEFIHEMTPFLVLSGKSIDDLGFPGSCEDDPHGYAYSTVQVKIQTNTTEYTGYLGFCFPQKCTVQDLNAFGQFMIDFIFSQYPYGVTGTFIDPTLHLQFSTAALCLSLFFLILLSITMTAPIQQWLQMCKESPDEQYAIKSVYIDLEHPQLELDQQRITLSSTTMQRLSIKYKWKQLWREQETYNIIEFSVFRILAVPLLLYGQIFWLTNFGAFNYYAFYQEIYDQFYVKFAIFAYYMPDIFIFISAFLFAKKIFNMSTTNDINPHKQLFKNILHKLIRLYPLYIVVLAIYWGISPSLHAGPVWYVYQNQVDVCNYAWWRALLMIDNWFTESCYPALWFVQVQVQLLIISSLLFYAVYLAKPQIGLYFLSVLIVASFVLLFVFSAQILVSVQIAIDPYTQLYYKSLYSHAWFYFMGILLALLSQKQWLRLKMQTYVIDVDWLNYFLKTLSIGLLILILVRPWVWWGEESLSMELAICRVATLLCFLVLFLGGIFVKQKNMTVLHKYGYYMYPVLLVSYFVAQSSFWSVGSFMYVSGYDVLNQAVPNFIISYALGIFLGLFFDFRTFISS